VDFSYSESSRAMDWLVIKNTSSLDSLQVREGLINARFVDWDYLQEYRQLYSYWDGAHIILNKFNPANKGYPKPSPFASTAICHGRLVLQ
jgi:hypothetical protein